MHVNFGEFEKPGPVMALEHLIYASVAAQNFEAPQLSELLQKARAANERRGLTGMLLHVILTVVSSRRLKARPRQLISCWKDFFWISAIPT
jgi:hypothetical protein